MPLDPTLSTKIAQIFRKAAYQFRSRLIVPTVHGASRPQLLETIVHAADAADYPALSMATVRSMRRGDHPPPSAKTGLPEERASCPSLSMTTAPRSPMHILDVVADGYGTRLDVPAMSALQSSTLAPPVNAPILDVVLILDAVQSPREVLQWCHPSR